MVKTLVKLRNDTLWLDLDDITRIRIWYQERQDKSPHKHQITIYTEKQTQAGCCWLQSSKSSFLTVAYYAESFDDSLRMARDDFEKLSKLISGGDADIDCGEEATPIPKSEW